MGNRSFNPSMYGAQNAAKIVATMGQPTPNPLPPGRGKTGRPEHKTGRMNKTEAAYAALLDARHWHGEILWYEFEAIKFRLADRCWYTPDFFVVTSAPSIEVHETKGYMEDDAAVKLRVFREMFPHIGLVIARRKGGTWTLERR